MKDQIKKIMIVGGGTSGWMAAAYLNSILNHPQKSNVEIVLLESPEVNIIGVGESTFDTIRNFCAAVELPEGEFLKKTDAVLKHGTYFKGWLDGGDDEYLHPFEIPQAHDGVNIMNHWVNLHQHGKNQENFGESVTLQVKLAKARKSPRSVHMTGNYEAPLPYSYNFDAILFGRYLREFSTTRGVGHMVDHVTEVVLDDNGAIKGVKTKENGFQEADFFIDCTGFAAILAKAMGNTDFIDYTPSLLCDEAVAMQPPFKEGDVFDPRPFTTSTAQDAGWIWEIDLYKRRGLGYVFSSQFCDADTAETRLREFVGAEGKDVDVRHLKMRIGRRKKPWYKNCLCVGLSAGFIEPLEATGIMFIDMGLRFFGEYYPQKPVSQKLIDRYNHTMGDLLDESRDFIILHYILTRRRDTEFWRTYANDIKVPDTLAGRLELWKHKVPTHTDFSDHVAVFIHSSYNYILYGMEWKHDITPGSVGGVDLERSQRVLNLFKQQQMASQKQAPGHVESLEALREGRRL